GLRPPPATRRASPAACLLLSLRDPLGSDEVFHAWLERPAGVSEGRVVLHGHDLAVAEGDRDRGFLGPVGPAGLGRAREKDDHIRRALEELDRAEREPFLVALAQSP